MPLIAGHNLPNLANAGLLANAKGDHWHLHRWYNGGGSRRYKKKGGSQRRSRKQKRKSGTSRRRRY